MSYRVHLFRVASIAIVLLSAEPVWATQAHLGEEGYVAHQIAHLLYIFAMGILVYWLQANGFIRQKGWRCIQISCLLLIVWNAVAFACHIVEQWIPSAWLLGDPDFTQKMMMGSGLAYVYYALRLEHLVCVPAMIFLLLGLRSLYRQALAARKVVND